MFNFLPGPKAERRGATAPPAAVAFGERLACHRSLGERRACRAVAFGEGGQINLFDIPQEMGHYGRELTAKFPLPC